MKALVAAAMSIAAAAVLVAGCSSKDQPAPASTPAAPPGPTLSGMFSVELGPSTDMTGKPYEGGTSSTETWAFRSECKDDKCVAAMASLDSTDPKKSPAWFMILDYVGNRWVGVRERNGKCSDIDTKNWLAYSLDPKPDGSLTGVLQDAVVNDSCLETRRLTLKRTGDLDPDVTLADPTTLPAWVESPAAGLRGRYTMNLTNTATGAPVDPETYNINTNCLRSGQRCLSLFIRDDGKSMRSYAFADGKWTLAFPPRDWDCKPSGKAKFLRTSEIPLPQPPQNPFPMLSGTEHQVYTGECPADLTYDLRVERAGI